MRVAIVVVSLQDTRIATGTGIRAFDALPAPLIPKGPRVTTLVGDHVGTAKEHVPQMHSSVAKAPDADERKSLFVEICSGSAMLRLCVTEAGLEVLPVDHIACVRVVSSCVWRSGCKHDGPASIQQIDVSDIASVSTGRDARQFKWAWGCVLLIVWQSTQRVESHTVCCSRLLG